MSDEEFEALIAAEPPAPADRVLTVDGGAPVLALRRDLAAATQALPVGGRVWLRIRRPETFPLDTPPGMRTEGALHRPLRHFAELATEAGFRLGTPIRLADGLHALLPLIRVGRSLIWPGGDRKYREAYRHFEKFEEPAVALDLAEAIRRLDPPRGAQIISLGVHDGREWGPFVDRPGQETWTFWGVDREPAALAAGRARFSEERFHFIEGEIANATALGLPPADTLLCLSTLQSRGVDREVALKQILRLVRPTCRVLFSFPQCHLTQADFIAAPFDKFHRREDRAPTIKAARYLIRGLYRQGFDEVIAFGGPYLYVLGRRTERAEGAG